MISPKPQLFSFLWLTPYRVAVSSQVKPPSIAHGLLNCSCRAGRVTGLPSDRTDRVVGQRP